MRIARPSLISLFLLVVTNLVFSQNTFQPKHPQLAQSYGDAPLAFELNQGQAPADIQFLSHSFGSSVEFGAARAVFTLAKKDQGSPHSITFQWLGTGKPANATGENELAGRTNYLVGDQQHWLRGIKNYERVRYRSIYPGVDLVYYGNHRKLEYDLELAAQADASKIMLSVQGADRVIPQADGSLLVESEAGDLSWQKPIAYQMKDGKRSEVKVAYKLAKGETLAFELGPYDHTRPLTIDPTLAYAAVIGPTEFGQYVAADKSGSAYLVTSTISPQYQTTPGSYMPTGQFSWQAPPSLYGGPQHPLLAITKFSPDGSTLVYSTYLGGSEFVCSDGNAETPTGNAAGGITVDANGNAIVSGRTDDTNFPVTANAIQKTDKNCSAPQDVIVSKLSADGSSLLYSTYLGSSGNDNASGVAVDTADNIFVTGLAQNSDFPSTKNLSSCTGYCSDVFVTKINANGTLGYSLLFGGIDSGMNNPISFGIAVDTSDNAYVAGFTDVPLPVVNALQPNLNAGASSAFVGEVNSSGTGFNFLTYLGGSKQSSANGIAVDSGGNIYVTGWTTDNDFPVANAYQSQNKAYPSFSGFLTKYSPGGRSYVYSTYLSGTKNTQLVGVKVGPDGKAFVDGNTLSSDYPVTSDAFQPANTPNYFVTVFTTFEPSGSSLLYSTYLGSQAAGESAQSESIAITPDGQSAFVAGYNMNNTNAMDFPVTPGAYNKPHNGDPSNNKAHAQVSASFVAKFCMNCAQPASISIASPQNGRVVTSPVHFVASAYDPDGVAAMQIYAVPGKVAYQTNSNSIDTNIALAPGSYNVVVQEWSNSGSYLKKTVNITVEDSAPTVTISSPAPGATVSDPVHVVATAKVNGTGTIVHYRVYSGQGVAVYDVNGSTLNANISFPQGALNMTVVAWDSTGAAGAANENITVNGGSGGSQVTITSPANYGTVSSPVTFAASATTSCSAGIYALQIYTNPGVLAYTAYASSVNRAISLSPGYYYGAVQAWDNCGGTFKTNVQFDVK